MEIEELRAKHLKKEFDVREFPVRAEAMVDFATSVGETAPYYTDPTHPDFRAVPTFPARFSSGFSATTASSAIPVCRPASANGRWPDG